MASIQPFLPTMKFNFLKRKESFRYKSVANPLSLDMGYASFWNFEMKAGEVCLLGMVVVGAVLLHLGPILHSALGVPMLYLLAGASYLSPFTGFFYIACGQFLPFPESSPNNPAQIGVILWLPMVLLRYHRINLNGFWRLWPVLPWLIWFWALTGEAVFLPNSDYVKALIYALIACQLANESKGQYMKCLFGLCLGAILVMIAYWAQHLGLPVEINDWGGDREGFARLGSVRADSVMVWPALLLGISGLLGIQVAFAAKLSPFPSPKWLTYLSLILTVVSLPPLVSTMCHGAFAGLFLIFCALIWAGWVAAKQGAIDNPRFRQLIQWVVMGVGLVVLLFIFDAFQMRTKAMALNTHYSEATAESGAAASRTGVWHDSINTILTYPLFGIRVTGDHEVITSEYAARGGYLSHNVFLDYGRYVGIPGMLMLAFFFFWPVYWMLRCRNQVMYLPFILAHFAMFIFWMSLSFQFYKTFWGLWMLMVMAVPAAGAVRPMSQQMSRQSMIQRSGSHLYRA